LEWLRQQPLRWEQWRVILDRILPHAHYLKITGGEPTLHPDFERLMRYIDDHEVQYTVFTNGCWRNPGRMLDVFGQVNHLRSLLISVHGATAAAHEAFTRIPGSFREVVASIQRATARRIPVVVSTVITRLNYATLDVIAELAHQLGAEAIAYNRFLVLPQQQAGTLDLTPTIAQLRQAVEAVERIKTAEMTIGGLRVMYGPVIPQTVAASSSTMCGAGEAFCAIDPWGNVTPCTHTRLACGNLLTDSLEAIWTHPSMNSWRNLRAIHESQGGCRALAVESGLGIDPLLQDKIVLMDAALTRG
jgi:MoaA/NifB/PqqE/SkfB family radical SAM enzyme